MPFPLCKSMKCTLCDYQSISYEALARRGICFFFFAEKFLGKCSGFSPFFLATFLSIVLVVSLSQETGQAGGGSILSLELYRRRSICPRN